MRSTKKKGRPGVPSGPQRETEKVVWLLADHFLHHVADNWELELFVAVGFEHHKDPSSKEDQANDGEQEEADKSDREMQHGRDHSDKKAENDVEDPYSDEANV